MLATGVFEIPADVQAEMTGRSWHDVEACPRFERLRLVCVRHRAFDGAVRLGELVVLADVANEVAAVFERIFAAGFPIASVRRIDAFDGDDAASMAANNSSGFNFRVIEGTDKLSRHGLGLAIDINPLQNPWLRGTRVDPPAGRAYIDRAQVRPGMIVRPGPVIEAFEAAGWEWGGDMARPDYHHFSKDLLSSARGLM